MTTDSNTPKDKSFQVVDKRRFDASGHERDAEGEATTKISASSTEPESTKTGSVSPGFTMSEATGNDDSEPVAFTSFIMSLATQVLVQLGEMPPPQGMEIPLDLESARQTIDIMAMLQRRTKGNLSPEESRFMEEVLHSLRISFINAKKKSA
ncbi:MAG: DUF1844 domain-containing protein [Pseudomonadota bacterium]|jgi:hypothetical protein